MTDFLIHLFAFLVTVPLLATLIALAVFKLKYNSLNIAFRKAAQWTAVFYIIAVDLILSDLLGYHMMFFIVLFFILITGMIMFGQMKIKGYLMVGRALNISWRLFFLIFIALYVILAVLIMVNNTMSAIF